MIQNLKSLDDWLSNPKVGEDLKAELRMLSDAEIQEAMGQELKFGTSGLRGIMGAGNGRMNIHTVAKVSQGLSQYLHSLGRAKNICIAYDCRHMSLRFAECAAMVFCANGFTVHMFAELQPTPVLSFAIRRLKAEAGIVITASHNPREYNGYKVYTQYGGQITDQEATAILEEINRCDLFESPRFMPLREAVKEGRLQYISDELLQQYEKCELSLIQDPILLQKAANKLHLIYTPLYGTGCRLVPSVLKRAGFSVSLVEEQQGPSGDFATTPYPNPEALAVYALAQKQAETETDLLLATDPDCDRFGVMARSNDGTFQLLSGNQQAVLICYYLLEHLQQQTPPTGYIYSSNVSTGLLRCLAEQYGVKFEETLTGFKYIAEKVEIRSSSKDRLIFAMEESNGCQVGEFIRDKDGVTGCLLISEVALYYKQNGVTLWEGLEEIYKRFGYYLTETLAFTLDGAAGRIRQHIITEKLRSSWPELLTELDVIECRDYLKGYDELPKSNLLKFYCRNGSWLAIRPSGTEPKLKIYLEAVGEDRFSTEAYLAKMKMQIKTIISSIV